MPPITDSMIRAAVSGNAYAAGQAYLRAGMVRELRAEAAKHRIIAACKGSGGAVYRQTIGLVGPVGKTKVDGACTCPVGYNCKHVAAVLLRYLGEQDNAPALAKPPSARKRPAATTAPETDFEEEDMAPPLAAWLRALADEVNAESEDYPPGVSKRLFFILGRSVPSNSTAAVLLVTLAVGDYLKNGCLSERFTTPDSFRLQRQTPAPKYIRPMDRAILRSLNGYQIDEFTRDPSEVLQDILATGRARLGEFPGRPAKRGPSRQGKIEWQIDSDGSQAPRLVLEGGAQPVLLPAPWYIDSETGEVGPVVTDVAPLMVKRLLAAPPVPAGQAVALRTAISATLPAGRVPMPQVLPHGGVVGGIPTAHLRLRRLQVPYQSGADRFGAAAAALSFRYESALIPAEATLREIVYQGTRYTVKRDPGAERALTAALDRIGFMKIRQVMPYGLPPEDRDVFVLQSRTPEARWMEFMLDDMPMLRTLGWDIELTADFPHRLVTASGPMQAELRETTGIDWFDLDLGVLVNGERVDLVPPLLKILNNPHAARIIAEMDVAEKAGKTTVITLVDGRRLLLEAGLIRPILATLLDLFGAGGLAAEDGRLGVNRVGAAEIAELEKAGLSAGMVWQGGDALRALGRMLQERGGIPETAIPKWFAADLRPYQQRGVDWLQFLREAGLAGVLADDMGLGKTVQTLAHICIEKQAKRLAKPVLVICPTSVVGNWYKEATRFAPKLRVLALQGADRKTRFGDITKSDIVISTYPLLSRDEDVLAAQDWHMLILDEAQTVKNPGATMAQAVRRLRADQRLCLTGTPMENHLGELWALFDFMMPGFLGTQNEFARRFRTPIEKGGDAVLHAALARRVAPFLLRRTKSQVVTELPPRTDIVETVQMEAPQRAVYEAIRLAMHTRVQAAIAEQGLAKSGIVILDALLKMRQACCDPRLLKMPSIAEKNPGSAKLHRLLELLETLREEGRSI